MMTGQRRKGSKMSEQIETAGPGPQNQPGARHAAVSWVLRLRLPLMLLTLLGLAWLLARDFSGAEFQHVLDRTSGFGLSLALLPGLAALLLKGVRLCFLGQSLGFRLSLWQGIKYQVIAISLASLTPGRAGEFSKVFLLARHERGQMAPALLTVLIERVSDLAMLGLLALSFCLFHLHNPALSLGLSVMTLLLLGLAAVLIRLAGRDISRIERLLPARFHSLLGQMPALSGPRLLGLTLLTLLIWCLEGLSQWVILLAAGFAAPLLPVLGINALVAISAVLSLLPVGLGTMELSALVLYGSLQIPQAGVLFLVAAARVVNLSPLFTLFALIALTDRPLLTELKQVRKK